MIKFLMIRNSINKYFAGTQKGIGGQTSGAKCIVGLEFVIKCC